MKSKIDQLTFRILPLLYLFLTIMPNRMVNAQRLYSSPPGIVTKKTLLASHVYKEDKIFASINGNQLLTKGYYFMQQVGVYNTSDFGAISKSAEADSIAAILRTHSVSGIEYGPLYFHQEDMLACIEVAQTFQLNGIDVWLTSGGLMGKIHAFNNDEFPSHYRAYSMAADGSLIPATVWVLGQSEKLPAFDSMNPEAMNWFLNRYKEKYLKPMKQYTSGYFFNEDCLFYGLDPGHQNNTKINYYELPAYSDAVLALWQKYCIDNSVIYNGDFVSKFPVHSPDMVLNGGGKTEYYPGYNVPDTVESGTALVSIPRNTGVWAAWDDFVISLYTESWIGGISKAVYEVNEGNPNFKGVIYFGLHDWSLAYEEVVDTTFCVDYLQRWVPWGTQRGIRLSKICSLPDIDYIICETFPPIQANLYQFASEFNRITNEHSKVFGLMVHRDDNWGLDGGDLETDRWDMIQSFQPVIIARYPIDLIFPDNQYYNEDKESLFDQRMLDYRPVNPYPPVIIQPVDHASGVSITPTLIWGACVGASKYHLQVSTDSACSQLIINDSTISVTSFRSGPLSDGTTFYWRVCGVTPGGVSNWSSTVSFTTIITSDIQIGTDIPERFELKQNYPNPFNPTTKISWQLAVGSKATIKVYDILGKEIAILVNEYKPSGKYEIEFSAKDLPSGVYFYRIKAGEFVQTRKMLLMK